jgi:hypothetical protein
VFHFSLVIFGLTGLVMINHAFNLKRLIDSWFIISGLTTAVLLFKRLFDQGGFDTFLYSWHKTKSSILFFLPKYWKAIEVSDEHKMDTIDDYIIYRRDKSWKKLPILLITVLTHLTISVILSLLMYYL